MGRIARNVMFATFGILFAQAIGSIRSFLLAKLVEPADYGIWTAAQTVASLAPIACLGTVEALLKRVPFLRGKGDEGGLRLIESSVLGTIVISAAFLSALFLGFPQVIWSSFVRENLLVVQITAASAAIGFLSAFYYYRCTAYEDFKAVSVLDSSRAILGSFWVLALAWKWGLMGAVVGFFLAEVCTWWLSGYVCGREHGPVKASFQLAPMAEAVKVGFPITIIWWIYVIHSNVGRMTAVSFLGNTQTGYFGVGGSLAMLFSLVPNTIGRVFYPRVNAQVGAKASIEELRKSVVMPTSAITLVLPITQVVIFYLLPIVYQDFLPKYREGLACAQILIFGAFFVGLIRNGANYLIAVDRQVHLMGYVTVSVALNAGLSYFLASKGFGINGIAFAASLGSAVLAILIWQQVMFELGYSRRERLALFASFCLPFSGALAAVFVVRLGFSSLQPVSIPSLALQAGIALAILAAVVLSFADTRNRAIDLYCRFTARFARA